MGVEKAVGWVPSPARWRADTPAFLMRGVGPIWPGWSAMPRLAFLFTHSISELNAHRGIPRQSAAGSSRAGFSRRGLLTLSGSKVGQSKTSQRLQLSPAQVIFQQ